MNGPTSFHLLLCLIFGLLPTVDLLALDPERRAGQHAFRQWRIEEGLPQNSVRAIAQTPDDLLWIATHAGLTRFDGMAFDRVDGHAILESFHVYGLAVDADGALWIGTNGGGLLKWHRRRFEHFDTSDGLLSNSVLSLEILGDRLWIGTEDGGLALKVLSDETEGFQVWGPEQGVPAIAIHGLAPQADGSCIFATMGAGIFRIDPDRGDPDGQVQSLGEADGLPSPMTRDVVVDREGTLWVGGHAGLARHPNGFTAGAETTAAWETLTGPDGDTSYRVSELELDQDGNVWIGTLGDGVWRYDGSRIERLPQTAGRQLNIVWSLLEDREGHLWAGTLGGGLMQLFDGAVLPVGEPEGLGSRQAVAVHEAPDGVLWVATRNAGLRRYRDGAWLEPVTTDDGLSHNGAWGLDFAADGTVWTAGFAPALDHWTPQSTTSYTTADGIAVGRVLAVLVDRQGDVWISTSGGLNRLHDGELLHYTTADGLVHNQTLSLAEPPEGSSNGRIWIGSNGGLSVWDEDTGFTNFTAEQGLRNERVWSILPDAVDGAWIGTFGGGLHRLRGGRIDRVLNASHGLPSNDVTALVDDGLGFLWLGTTRGLARLPWDALHGDPRSVTADRLPVLSLDVRDGMRSAEAYGGQPIGIRSRTGDLWFATLDGMVRIDPTAVESPPPPRIVIRDIQVDGASPEADGDGPPELPPDHRLISVSFTATTLAAPSRIRFRHRLMGLDETWRDLGSRRVVELSRLPAGDYGLEIEAADVQGQFHGQTTRFDFSVRPRFTQTRTFYGLAALLLVALGVGAQQLRVRRLRQREAELQRTAEEAIANVRTLSGMLPMCASCKNIRDDEGYWQGVETYISDHSEAAFSHGLCPTCSARTLEELNLLDKVTESSVQSS